MSESLTIQNINERWSQIKAEQGIIGKAWNGIKEFTNLGQSESDCESMLNAYNNHEISLFEAIEYIENFEKNQKNASNLIANIASGVASIAIATTAAAGNPIGLALAFKKGAAIGAVAKAGLKTLDRATNNIEGDALDAKEIIRDGISGAVNGTTSAVSSGVFQGVKEAKKTKTILEGLGLSVFNGAKCGIKCGLVSGAVDYTTNAALDKDKHFSFNEMIKSSETSAIASGSIGAVFGAGIFGVEGVMGNLGKETTAQLNETSARDSILSSLRKIAGNARNNAKS